jgi:hypothetical protein
MMNSNYFNIASPTRRGSTCRVSGQDYIGLVSFPTTANPGATLFNAAISPTTQALANTRLSLFGKMFEKFFFSKLRFHCTAQAPTSAQGSYILAYDHDSADATPPTSDDGVRALMSYQDSVTQPVWTSSQLSCTVASDPQKFYYTNYVDEEERVAFQGQIYVASLTNPSVQTYFSLWLEYEVHFYEPQLDLSSGSESLTTAGSNAISATALQGWNAFIGGTGDATVATSPVISLIKDSNANVALQFLKQGYYIVDQYFKTSAGGTGTAIVAPTFVPNNPSDYMPGLAVTGLDTLSAIASVGASAYAKHLIKVPEHGGNLYGSITGADTFSTQKLRAFAAPSSSIL